MFAGTIAMLQGTSPHCLSLVRLRHLDSFGLIASTANLLLLRQSMATKAQLKFWDRWTVAVSQVLDPCFRYNVGKSIVAIWCNP